MKIVLLLSLVIFITWYYKLYNFMYVIMFINFIIISMYMSSNKTYSVQEVTSKVEEILKQNPISNQLNN